MNTPNKLSVMRIILVPIMVFFYLVTFLGIWGKIVAVVLFLTAAITDLLDGKIARKTGQVTDLGKLLDPIADKMLYDTGMVLIVVSGAVPAPYGVIGLLILLFRDFAIDGLRQVAASKGIVIAAVLSGKLKAIFHYIQIPLFMLLAATSTLSGDFWNVFNYVLLIVACVFFAIATLVTIWSLFDYYAKNKHVFKEKNEEKWKQI